MRLICPNCGAQYAVDERVIPEAGRDVQCSNCGNTWFQRHPDHDPELAEELTWEPPRSAPAAKPVPVPELAPEPAPKPGAELAAVERPEPPDAAPEGREAAAPEPETAPDAATAAAGAPEPDIPEPDIPETEVPRRQKADESVLSVLREEAEREHAARKAESGPPEYQPDLGVPSPEAAPHRGTADYTQTAPHPQAPDTGGGRARFARPLPMATPNRRGRLPDVEQITSTLEPSDAEVAAQTEDLRHRRQHRRGLRIGLGLAFLAFGLAALVYTRSERIATAVPETAAPLGSYVENIDAGRRWLDRALRGLASPEAPVDGDG